MELPDPSDRHDQPHDQRRRPVFVQVRYPEFNSRYLSALIGFPADVVPQVKYRRAHPGQAFTHMQRKNQFHNEYVSD